MNKFKKLYNKKRFLGGVKSSTFYCGPVKETPKNTLRGFRIISRLCKEYPYLNLQNQSNMVYSLRSDFPWDSFFKEFFKDGSVIVLGGRYVNPHEISQNQGLDAFFSSLRGSQYSVSKCLEAHDKSFK